MIILIENSSDLVLLTEKALSYECVAIDTEFFWETTYFPILGLIQIGLPTGECYLIDTVTIKNLKPLGKLMASKNTTKILHDAVQDLTIIRQYTDTFPNNIFDTRKAAGFIGLPCTISLANLLTELLNVNLAKTETRTNWLKRPLSDKQKEYAADDVLHLCEIKKIIEARVKGTPVEHWLIEEMHDYDRNTHYQEKTGRNQYIKVKGARKLKPAKLAILRELAAWREIEAYETNRPRQRILSDAELMLLVYESPKRIEDLEKINEFPFKRVRERAPDIIRAIHTGLTMPSSRYPQMIEDDSPEFVYTKVDETFSFIENRCASHSIDPNLIGSKVEIKKYLCSGDRPKMADHKIMVGWRRQLLLGIEDIIL